MSQVEAPAKRKVSYKPTYIVSGFCLVLAVLLYLFGSAAHESASNAKDFQPIDEFLIKPWYSIKAGAFEFGPSKALLYLFLAMIVSIIVGLWIGRGGLVKANPNRKQALVESVYGFLDTNVARATLPQESFAVWFPYLASLFTFIWVLNLISFIPLPVDPHNAVTLGPITIPGLAIYAATSNLAVTLALTLMTISFQWYQGIKHNGFFGYFKSWVPHAPAPMIPILAILETLAQLVRIVSLSVRLWANMLAGHMLIILGAGIAILIGTAFAGIAGVALASAFYLLEVGLVASLQAFIFALLSGIYIGGAIKPQH